MKKRGPGRPPLGHEGHRGRADRCDACRLREWRQARGLTQEDLASQLPGVRGAAHVDLRTVRRWERGERAVPKLVLQFLAMMEKAKR